MQAATEKISTEHWFANDIRFNQLYPVRMRELSARHWTPLPVAQHAARFLATEHHVRVLDIGSGVGKFCLAAAYYQPRALYYGVEQRKLLVQYANEAKSVLRQEGVHFIQGNFTQLDFRDYDHFYFYDAFYENLLTTNKIDNDIEYSEQLYHYYCHYLYHQLKQKPAGTRVVTYHSLEDEMPEEYQVVGSEMSELLKFWVKTE